MELAAAIRPCLSPPSPPGHACTLTTGLLHDRKYDWQYNLSKGKSCACTRCRFRFDRARSMQRGRSLAEADAVMHDRYDLEHVIPEGSLEKASILKE